MRRRIGDIVLDPNDPTFNASQVVGQSLIANVQLDAYNDPQDDSVVMSFGPGQTVGVVYSWIDVNTANGINALQWMFQNNDGSFYYIPHAAGKFNVQALVDAGALTTAQQTKLANDANKPGWQVELETYLPYIGGGLLALGVLYVILKTRK